jgi:hypothetical protein
MGWWRREILSCPAPCYRWSLLTFLIGRRGKLAALVLLVVVTGDTLIVPRSCHFCVTGICDRPGHHLYQERMACNCNVSRSRH